MADCCIAGPVFSKYRTGHCLMVLFVSYRINSHGTSSFPQPSKQPQYKLGLLPFYSLQGEAGPPSEKELVSNAVQQAVAPSGTI